MAKKYERILVAVDGSDQAKIAFNRAIDIAERDDAELFIAHVIDYPAASHRNAFDKSIKVQIKQNAQEILDEHVNKAKEKGVENTRNYLEEGSPKYILSEKLPQEHDIELIIIGATGVGAVGRFLIGSVADSVTRNAKCDVLVVRESI